MKKRLSIIISTLLIFFILPLNASAAEGAATITITVTIVEAEVIGATVEFSPQTIRKERRRNIQCLIELPQPYEVENIDVDTIRLIELNGYAIEPPLAILRRPKIGDSDKDDIPDLMVRFSIKNLILELEENRLTVIGNMIDDNRIFKGTGAIWVIKK